MVIFLSQKKIKHIVSLINTLTFLKGEIFFVGFPCAALIMCAYPLPLSASAFSSSPPRFLQVMRGEETNERKEGRKRERERCVCFACAAEREGKGAHSQVLSPTTIFFAMREI